MTSEFQLGGAEKRGGEEKKKKKRGSIFNFAIVLLPVHTQLLWARNLEAGAGGGPFRD